MPTTAKTIPITVRRYHYRELTLDSFTDALNTVADMNRDELKGLILEDMEKRGIKADQLEKYFSEVLITLQKSTKDKEEKKSKKEQGAMINYLPKEEGGLLFKFDDSFSKLLKGFTIDLRIFFNLLRKMIIIKLNADKIWTRQFYSQDLEKIFVILKPLDAVIENRAMVFVVYFRVKATLSKSNWDS